MTAVLPTKPLASLLSDAPEIDVSMSEILDDLCRPGLPPGRWNVPGTTSAEAMLVAGGQKTGAST